MVAVCCLVVAEVLCFQMVLWALLWAALLVFVGQIVCPKEVVVFYFPDTEDHDIVVEVYLRMDQAVRFGEGDFPMEVELDFLEVGVFYFLEEVELYLL